MSSLRKFFPPNMLPSRAWDILPYYLLIFTVMVFYGNVYDNAFLYDDQFLITDNRYLHSWHFLGHIFTSQVNSGAYHSGYFYRPLQNVLYLLVYQAAGLSEFAFHLLNVSLHAANACLVYALGRKLKFNPWAAFFAALIWALHPIHTEAVTYMSATADTLYAFFCLLGVVILLPDFTWRKVIIVTPVFILGLLSKETAVVFPLLAASCIYLSSKDRLKPKAYLPVLPFLAISIAYICVRLWITPFSHGALLSSDPISKLYAAHISLRIYTFLATIPAYLGLLVWPAHLHLDHEFKVLLDPWFPKVYAGALILMAAIAQIVWGRGRRGLALSWGFIWFACAQIPNTGLFIAVNSLFLEHWMYLPSAGLFLGIAETLAGYCKKPLTARNAGTAAATLAVIFGILTYRQNIIWSDPVVFYNNIIQYGVISERARDNLGLVYMDQGQYGKAMEQFQLALKGYDLMPETHQDIAALLARNPDGRKHIHQEIEEMKNALALDPNFLPAYEGLEYVYNQQGDKAKAAEYKRRGDEVRRSFASQ